MPARPPKACRAPGCGNGTTNRNGYCDKHQSLHQPVGWKRRQSGKTTTQRGYGAKWQKIRKEALKRDDYICVQCRKAGKVAAAHAVDHITPKASGGGDELSNLQSLCRDCHKDKTAQESTQARRGGNAAGHRG
jgi:5-methylcytosine-specific restriction protein A